MDYWKEDCSWQLQIIVCSNGEAGINFEHTGVDGHTVLRYAADVYTELVLLFAKVRNRPRLALTTDDQSLHPFPLQSSPISLVSRSPQQASQRARGRNRYYPEKARVEAHPRTTCWG